jgi:hypothetical protein
MFGRRLIAVGLCGAAGLVFAACGGETNPATNVTLTSATLNAHASCQAGESGKWWFRWRPTGNPWRETPRNSDDCATDDAQDVSAELTGLTPGTDYEFEICGKPTNPFVAVCANANGHGDNADRDPGSPIDSFHTPAATSPRFSSWTAPSPSGNVVRADTAADPNAHDLWGVQYGCANDSRVTNPQTGGDPHPTALGVPQGDSAYRKLTVYDGDNYSGERCELGYNTWHGGLASASNPYGTFYNYFAGDRRTTYVSLRLPTGFPVNVNTWQAVMQMKQAGPANNSGGTPILEMDVWGGRWRLRQSLSAGHTSDSRELWSTPAQTGAWTRFAYDVTYSQNPSIGSITVYVDLNGDGDFDDAGEQSPTIHTYTLKYEIPGPKTDLAPGQSIPSHLRMGIYHHPSVSCPAPSGCSVDIDNVQVARP